MPVLIAILSVIKYNFVSYIYKIRYFIAGCVKSFV